MENKKENKPFITVKEAIVSVLVLLLFAIAFEKPFPIIGVLIPTRNVLENEVHQFAMQIEEITPSKIEEELNKSGKPTLMFMYASWCTYCKKLMANITSLKNEGKIDDINFLPISVDRRKTELSRYLLKYNYDKLFTPYIIDDSNERELKRIIINKGGNYTPSIPYSVIFDIKGNVIEEINGVIGKISLQEKLNAAKQ